MPDEEKQRHQQGQQTADLIGQIAFQILLGIVQRAHIAQAQEEADHLRIEQHTEQGEGVGQRRITHLQAVHLSASRVTP